MTQPERDEHNRWRERPVAATCLRLLALALPMAAGLVVTAVLRRVMPAPRGTLDVVTRWIVLIGSSGIAVFAVDRIARRLLPLATLLKLSVVFPDRAPSRLKLAREAGSVRRLSTTVESAKAHGLDSEPVRAAETIITLIAALGAHDRRTRGHSERVRTFTDLIAEELDLSDADRDKLRWAALLHDVGKLMVSAEILNKPGRPTEEEWAEIHRHPAEGARLAAPLIPWLGPWAAAIEFHHERFDGRGYPHRIAAREISLAARIVAVADSYEVMTASRAYKKAMSPAAARAELTRCAGTQFDPTIVRAFLNVSIGRLWWRTGPIAWVAQLPFLGWLPRVGDVGLAAGRGFVTAGGAVGSAVIGATLTVGAVAHPLIANAAPPRASEVTTLSAVDPGDGTPSSSREESTSTSGKHDVPTSVPSPTLSNGDPAPTTSSSGPRLAAVATTTTQPGKIGAGDRPGYTPPTPPGFFSSSTTRFGGPQSQR
jgi:putative nucleotidyltransferase with HDIG domain